MQLEMCMWRTPTITLFVKLLRWDLSAPSLESPEYRGALMAQTIRHGFTLLLASRWTALGNLYVSDTGNYTIRKITPTEVVTTIAGSAGGAPAPMMARAVPARFGFPRGIAIDGTSNLYVADAFNYTIRKIMPVGASWNLGGGSHPMRSAGTGREHGREKGSVDGTGGAARFIYPLGTTIGVGGRMEKRALSL